MGVTEVGDEPCQEDGSLVLTYGRWETEVYIGKKDRRRGGSKEGRSVIGGLLFYFPARGAEGVTKLRCTAFKGVVEG